MNGMIQAVLNEPGHIIQSRKVIDLLHKVADSNDLDSGTLVLNVPKLLYDFLINVLILINDQDVVFWNLGTDTDEGM
jgi:hypothetical protein